MRNCRGITLVEIVVVVRADLGDNEARSILADLPVADLEGFRHFHFPPSQTCEPPQWRCWRDSVNPIPLVRSVAGREFRNNVTIPGAVSTVA